MGLSLQLTHESVTHLFMVFLDKLVDSNITMVKNKPFFYIKL